jgi:hypothetical protein
VAEHEQMVGLISLNELTALSVILQFYERHLWYAALPSSQRSRQAVEIHALIVKLSLLRERSATILTEGEIECIYTALDLFLSETKRRILPSESRDNILVSCTQLREYLATIFPPEQSTNRE